MSHATTAEGGSARKPEEAGPVRRSSIYPSGSSLLFAGGIMLGAACIGLGVLGVIVGDFALQWQPVPEGLPARRLAAYATAVVVAALGAGVLVGRLRLASAATLSVVFLAWTLLHVPGVVANPLSSSAWLGLCEILAIACGALMLAAATSTSPGFSRWGALSGRIVFGACLPVFGLSHFVYTEFTANMIPDWIPFPVFWAYFTGAGHVAAGVSILSGVLIKTGSLLFALMVSGIVLLLHIPGVIGDPASRLEWTMLAIAAAITAAAWCAAASIVLSRQR